MSQLCASEGTISVLPGAKSTRRSNRVSALASAVVAAVYWTMSKPSGLASLQTTRSLAACTCAHSKAISSRLPRLTGMEDMGTPIPVETAHREVRRPSSLADAYTIEGVDAERADAEVPHFLAHRLVHGGMRHRGDRHLALEDHLRLLVQLGACGHIGGALGGLDQFVVVLEAPLGEVVAVHRIATIEGAEPVVRVTVVTAPADQHGIVLAGLGALEVPAPLVADDACLDADLRPVGLQHFGDLLGVGVVRTLHRHGPQGDFGAFLDAGVFQQLPGLLRIEGRVLDLLVIGPLGRRHAVDGQLT